MLPSEVLCVNIQNIYLSHYLPIAKDLVNILFWIIASVVAILTYYNAKKTIFSPIKTEVFKIQLVLLNNVLEVFQNKHEIDYINSISYDEILYCNCLHMIESYGKFFFKENCPEINNYPKEKIAHIRYTQEAANKYLRHVGHIKEDLMSKHSEQIDHAQPDTIWNDYKHDILIIPNNHEEYMQKINQFINSPIMPDKIRKEIILFHNAAEENVLLIGEVISNYYKEMPKLYKTPHDLINFQDGVINRVFYSKIIPLEPIAEKILNEVKNYLLVENIMKG